MTPALDTIFAPASGAGRAAIAVVRLSGPATGPVLAGMAGRLPAPRRATLATLRDPATGEVLDRSLVLWFPGPQSFTGEDAAELHLHGGRAVVAAVLACLSRAPGCRPAEPGEFTRRAFRNDRLDLGAVEGLADLVDAQTQAQRRQALRHLDGALGRWVEPLREALLDALALAEASIDFSDEDAVAASFGDDLERLVGTVLDAIEAQLRASGRGRKLRDGLVVAIAGPPNVGKSTLMNALSGREVAIVSVHAGTTRDPIEVELELGGCPVTLVDTAGLRPTDDPVEIEGIARARARAASADLVLWLDDAAAVASAEPPLDAGGRVWRLATKSDIAPVVPREPDFLVSARTGAGLDTLVEALSRFAADELVGGEDALVTRLRHRAALERARHHLAAVLSDTAHPVELVTEDLRAAIHALASLIGAVEVEDVLGAIFARFCIGK